VENHTEYGFIDKAMVRRQQKVRTHKDNFNKTKGLQYGDNRQDEMMADVLQLYPNLNLYMLSGEEGKSKRITLQKDVRKYFDKLHLNDEMMNASGKKDRKGLRKIGRTIATASLVIPRGSTLLLVKENFRGLAKRFSLLNEEGKKKLFEKWEKLGGKEEKLKKAIDEGKTKPVLVCGKKCRAKAGANPQLPVQSEEYSNAGGTAIMVGSALGVVSALVSTIGSGKNASKNYNNQRELLLLEAEIKEQERKENAIDSTMTPSERKIADEIIKAQNKSGDPKEAIKNNPNLTAEEKQEALKQLGEIEKSKIGIDTWKKFAIGGALLIIAYAGWNYYKNKQQNS
jgi:hypothetical protein